MSQIAFYRCSCSFEFPEALGKYGCPNCESEVPASLIEPTEEVDRAGDDRPVKGRTKKGLTGPEEVFAQAIAGGMNQSAAFRRAHPHAQGWKGPTVNSAASKMAARAIVRTRIADLVQQISAQFVLERSDLLRATAAIAFADPRRLVNDEGRLIPLDQLDAQTAAAIASVEQDEFGRIKYKFWDKNSAQERLFKHKGMFEKDNTQKADALKSLLDRLPGRVMGPVHEAPQQLMNDGDTL